MPDTLDPEDWDRFRRDAQAVLDAAIDSMAKAADRPWQPVPPDVAARYAIGTGGDVPQRLADDIMPYHGGNPHPRFWGWVQGTGLATDILAGIAGAAINANTGGRDHGAIYLERAVIDWTRRQMGFPESASGVLVTGTSQAALIALSAARLQALGPEVRKTGQGAARLRVYAVAGVHNAIRKAVELLGIGSDNLRHVPATDGRMETTALRTMIAEDRAAGLQPMAIVGTAGSVDLGRYDDLQAVADVARDEGLWFHVDGAFGAWIRIADEPWSALGAGIEMADSIALDFHKWMYVGYDCGCVLIRDEAKHRAAFAARPAYLEGSERGLAGGDPWFCDYGIDLSRGNRALKVWCAIETLGAEALAASITRNCSLARLMYDTVTAEGLHPGPEPVSNVCVFSVAPGAGERNARIAETLQESGEAVFSTTRVDGEVMLRAAITNHRTSRHDVIDAVHAAKREARTQK
jgi:glutamate/tyrosine decarboxylase-like PLP-dependent enzyme